MEKRKIKSDKLFLKRSIWIFKQKTLIRAKPIETFKLYFLKKLKKKREFIIVIIVDTKRKLGFINFKNFNNIINPG